MVEDLVLKTHFKGHGETCLLILLSNLGHGVSLPMLSGNFLGCFPNHIGVWKFWAEVAAKLREAKKTS